MSLLRWLPWRFVLRRVASAHGFLDPVTLLNRLQRFAQPAEVAEPIELLRAGARFHARGLINSKVIQHNLDWIWPYWTERQFDPTDPSFVPRAFSLTHVNLTHRNWTAVGLPDSDCLPICDPRGLVTPHHDGFSLDAWLVGDDGSWVIPSRAPEDAVSQRLELRADGPAVVTETATEAGQLAGELRADNATGAVAAELRVRARMPGPGWLVLSLRPYNPEGVAFVHDVQLQAGATGWQVDRDSTVGFSQPCDGHRAARYRDGDAALDLLARPAAERASCPVGMASAAALFRLADGQTRDIVARVPLETTPVRGAPEVRSPERQWADVLSGAAQLAVPDMRIQRLFEQARASLVLHSATELYPGPYTYKRFWFRDAAFMVNALLNLNLADRAERALDRFPQRQGPLGYFRSQEGEWDSNGEALWAMGQWCALTGNAPKADWLGPIEKGARWIARKRLPEDRTRYGAHAGLLPAGFSAEHLGPNDYYYWDDFWGIAGLEAAATLLGQGERPEAAREFADAAAAFRATVAASLAETRQRLGRPAMPAAPERRLDAGAVGSLVAGYPLQLFAGDDPRLTDLCAFLRQRCFVIGGFFQDMIHAGINAYLTLHVAQVLLRSGDVAGYRELLLRVAELASPTGQWPEAIHPRTLGGCMGDGHHVWASAEWVMLLRNAFVREEGETLVLGSGLLPDWLQPGAELRFGPAPTRFGTLDVSCQVDGDGSAQLRWHAQWRDGQPVPICRVGVPGFAPQDLDGTVGAARLTPNGSGS